MTLRAGFVGVSRHADPHISDFTGAVADATAFWALFSDSVPGLDAVRRVDEAASPVPTSRWKRRRKRKCLMPLRACLRRHSGAARAIFRSILARFLGPYFQYEPQKSCTAGLESSSRSPSCLLLKHALRHTGRSNRNLLP
jgi:hypothetical protein